MKRLVSLLETIGFNGMKRLVSRCGTECFNGMKQPIPNDASPPPYACKAQ